MRCVFLLLFLLLLLPDSVFAFPALVVESLEHDFGEIVQGSEINYTFIIPFVFIMLETKSWKSVNCVVSADALRHCCQLADSHQD
jgi:hypothetical protein